MPTHQDKNKTEKPWYQASLAMYLAIAIIAISVTATVVLIPQQYNETKEMPLTEAEQSNLATAVLPEVTVYKSETCNCCNKWITHLEQEGFKVTSHNTKDMNTIKQDVGLQPGLASCHTAIVDGYVIEGHVPAADIKQLLTDKPAVLGLTAPGMPKDSPGMQPVGEKPKGYDVLAFDKEGNTTVFKRY